jgi:hypothetical protein
MPNRSTQQQISPCGACPWRRKAMPGWLGSEHNAEEWIQVAHSDSTAECHEREPHRCAGLAIYRANVGKRLRDPKELVLPKDKETVFASPQEFLNHHNKLGHTSADPFKNKILV